MRIKWVISLLIMGMLLSGTVYAQDPPAGGTTIHVVQRDENLYRIAMQYGTTVEAIAEANGITDPRYIAVGQRLLIPNAQLNAPGAVMTHMIIPGDSLETLAYTYHTTIDQLATANSITNPALLFAGQDLTINQGSESAGLVPRALTQVSPGDNLFRMALRYQVPINALVTANQLNPILPLYAGQRLWIPGGDNSITLTDFAEPLRSFALSPVPAVQGKTISIHATTTGPAILSGTFIGYPIQFVTQDVNQHYALFGIHAFASSGVYPMEITVTTPEGSQSIQIFRVRVDEGGYGAEDISLDTTQQDLLNPQVTEPEWERVATLMSSFTSQRYFDGLMGLPSTGAISSQFGTRRMYNGGMLDTFHSGTDFAAGPGSPVVAPAAGVVILAENLPVRGNATIIDHGWGVITGYWHQSELYVAVGDVVAPGQTIGLVGSTGRSTGPHLHWEMWVSGVQVDPMQWVQQSFP